MLAAYFVLRPFALRVIYSDEIPTLPSLNGYSANLIKHIEEANTDALDTPYSSEVVGNLGMIYHSNFFYDEAELCYNLAKQLDEDEWRWFYYGALIKEELGDAKGAIKNLERVGEINRNISNAWFRLGNSYLKQNAFAEAASAFQNVRESGKSFFASNTPNKGAFPLVVYAKLNLARVYINQEKYNEANSELEILIKKSPRFGPGYRLFGQLLTTIGKIEEGKKLTMRAGDFDSYQPPADPMFNELVLKSRNTDFILKQIDIALKSENFEWGEVLCKHILDYDSRDIEAISKYILVKLVKFETNGLDERLQTYFEYYSKNQVKLMDMAQLLYRWKQNKFAIRFLERAIKVEPSKMDATLLYLRILARSRIDKKVIKLCEDAIKLAPKNSDLRTEYGRMLAIQGKEAAASKQFNLALKYNPKNEATLILLGIIAQEKGDVGSAIKYYRRSVIANPLNIKTVLRLGNYFLELKKWNEAINLFEGALESSPNNIDLLERIAWIKSTCPNANIRNGTEALKLGKRIALIRKSNTSQEIKCGIALAVAYAEVGNFSRANIVLKNMIGRSNETNTKKYIPNIESLIRMFNSKTPFRL